MSFRVRFAGWRNTQQPQKKMLKQEVIAHIYLGTHFWHMPRAEAVFGKHDLKVIPAQIDFYQKD